MHKYCTLDTCKITLNIVFVINFHSTSSSTLCVVCCVVLVCVCCVHQDILYGKQFLVQRISQISRIHYVVKIRPNTLVVVTRVAHFALVSTKNKQLNRQFHFLHFVGSFSHRFSECVCVGVCLFDCTRAMFLSMFQLALILGVRIFMARFRNEKACAT